MPNGINGLSNMTTPTDHKKLAKEARRWSDLLVDEDGTLRPFLRRVARALLALDEENQKLEKKFSLAAKLVSRAPFCSDCRDKVDREICYRCENQRLRTALEEMECDRSSCGSGNPWRLDDHEESCPYRIAREALERK